MKRLLDNLNGVSLLCKTVESCLRGYLKMKTNFLKQSTLSKVQANPLVQSNHLHVKAITVQYKKNANLIPPPPPPPPIAQLIMCVILCINC